MTLWILAATSLTGTVLNIHKNRLCFALWSMTNMSWTLHNFLIKEYAQTALYAVYTGLAVWGMIKWRREEKADD